MLFTLLLVCTVLEIFRFFFFLSMIPLDIQDLLWFCLNFRIIYSIFLKTNIQSLKGITLSLYITLDSMDNWTILIFPVHKHRISFHLLMSTSFSFINLYRFSTSCVKFIPNYFTLFVSTGNGTDCSLDFFFRMVVSV
jgi:hypothetical protein